MFSYSRGSEKIYALNITPSVFGVRALHAILHALVITLALQRDTVRHPIWAVEGVTA